jgi:pseudaminic acid biosynthesis-associated methylase
VIDKSFQLFGYEINPTAVKKARELNIGEIFEGTILERLPRECQFDLVFTKVVLIHIKPSELNKAYDNIYELSKKYILICEYHNISPVDVTYRGHEQRLFKRDFAGDLLQRYELKLIDYGFVYHRDKNFHGQDDMNWFLFEK